MDLGGLFQNTGVEEDPFAATPDAHQAPKEQAFDPSSVDEFSAVRGGPEKHRPKQAPKGKRFNVADHHDRTKTLLTSMGYFDGRVEWQAFRSGQVIKRDLWGLFDRVAVKDGRFLGVQISSRDAITTHVRKMCSDEPITKGSVRTYRQNLEAFLAAGGEAWVIGWGQPDGYGGKWVHQIRKVTMQDLQTVISGGRISREAA